LRRPADASRRWLDDAEFGQGSGLIAGARLRTATKPGIDPKPKYLGLKRTERTDERLCNGPIHLLVIG
jgi:hypothetical protein